MTRRFKRKTLAISIAAALFGGMALAVAPIMTPIAWANQFEASALGTVTETKIFNGLPTATSQFKTGTVQIESTGMGWASDDGRFSMTFPAGTRLVDGQGTLIDLPTTNRYNLIPGFHTRTATNTDISHPHFLDPTEAEVDGSGRLVVTFLLYTSDPSGRFTPTSFNIGARVYAPNTGDLRVDFADDPDDPLGLGSNSDLKGIKIATVYDTTAVVEAGAATSVDSGLTNQPVADITTELLVKTPAYSRILFTLDNGKWVGDPIFTTGTFKQGTLNKLNDTQLEYLSGNNQANPHDKLVLSGLKINADGVPSDTDINVTVTSQADGTDVAIPGFGIHKVKVGQTGSASGQGVNVSLVKTGSDYQTLYAGRIESQTLSDTVKLTETRPASLIENGTLNYTLSTGVFYNEEEQPTSQGFNALTWTMDPTGTGGLGAACEPTPAGAKAANCWVESASSATAGTLGFLPEMWIDLRDVTTEGDLQVTIDGTAWNSWTDNTVKVGEIIRATESKIDGDVALVRLSPNSIVSATLPDIVIQETRAGALVGWKDAIEVVAIETAQDSKAHKVKPSVILIEPGRPIVPGRSIVLGLDDGMKLIAPADAVARVFDKNGNEVPGGLLIFSPKWSMPHNLTINSNDFIIDPNERTLNVLWPDLPAANGPYRIVVSGLQVRTQLAGGNELSGVVRAGGVTPVKDYNLTVAGSFEDEDIKYGMQSDTGAKPFMQSFKVASVIDSAKAWLDVEGPITEQTIYSNILPSSADLGKMGSYYLMLQMPPQFTGDWSIWTLGPTAWTEVEPATTDEGLCSTMTSYQSGVLENVTNWPLIVPAADMTAFEGVRVWMGYGVGATLLKPLAPCLDMLKNGTYWYVYTVE